MAIRIPASKISPTQWVIQQKQQWYEAARTRTWQDPSSVERQMDPRFDLKGAPFQPTGLFKKLGTFTGMIATANIYIMPPRPKRVDVSLVSCRVDRQFPSSSNQSSGSHHKPSGMFHSHPDKGGIGCAVVLTLPRNLVHFTPVKALLQVGSSETIAFPQMSLQSVGIHLKCYTSIKEDNERHHNQHESKISLLNQSKGNFSITPNSWLDLGFIFNLQLDPSTVPSFNHSLIQVSYDLRAHITLEVGGKRLKEDFMGEAVQALSNRTANSPLSRDYLCTFVPEIRRSTFEASPMVYPEREREAEAEISNAYLAISRLLSQNSIPCNPVSAQTGNPTIMFHGRFGVLVPQKSAQSTSNAPPSGTPVDPIQNPAVSDRELLHTILNSHAGFRATSLSKQARLETRMEFAKVIFIWHDQMLSSIYAAEQERDNGVYIRIEITGTFILPSLNPMLTFYRCFSSTIPLCYNLAFIFFKEPVFSI